MSDDIDRYLFGDGSASDEDQSSDTLDDDASIGSGSISMASFVEAPASTPQEAVEWEVWPEEPTLQTPDTVDAYSILREGGDEAVAALVAAENWRGKFGDIIADVLGHDYDSVPGGHCQLGVVGQFPWHVMAVRWLDGDSAEDSFVAALDTALREREERAELVPAFRVRVIR